MGAPWKFIAAVQGVNAGGASIATGKLTKTSGVDGIWDAGASTVEKIAGDGFIEFSNPSLTLASFCGLSLTDVNVDPASANRGIFMDGASGYRVYDNAGVPVSGTRAATDIFRVQRIGTEITYWRNGERLYTSPVASSGGLLIDASVAYLTCTVSGIRFYDAALRAWRSLTWQNVTNVTAAVDTPATGRRITFATPTTIKAGDQLVAIFGGQGPELFTATSATWAFVDSFMSATSKRGLAVYRRIATDSEPTSYTFDLATQQETLGALLVYRDLDAAIALTGSLSDVAATTGVLLPVLTTNRLTDLYLGGLIIVTPGAATATPGAGANERIEFNQSALGVNTVKLDLLDATLPVVGKVSKRVTLSSSLASSAFSLLLGGGATFGADLAFSPIVPGAIGLPVVGI